MSIFSKLYFTVFGISASIIAALFFRAYYLNNKIDKEMNTMKNKTEIRNSEIKFIEREQNKRVKEGKDEAKREEINDSLGFHSITL